MKKTKWLAVGVLGLASICPILRACEAEMSCTDGKYVFCYTLINSCEQYPVCSRSGDGVCCSTWDKCIQEVNTYCDFCINTQ